MKKERVNAKGLNMKITTKELKKVFGAHVLYLTTSRILNNNQLRITANYKLSLM